MPSDTTLARIEMQRAWLAQREREYAHFCRTLPWYHRGLVALTAVGPMCFFVSKLAGLWGSFCMPFFCLCTYGLLRTRRWELLGELDEIRKEIARLSAE